MTIEEKCPVCGAKKFKIQKNDDRFIKVLNELGIKDINNLTDASKMIIQMNRYVFDCNCAEKNSGKIAELRRIKD